MHSLYQVASQKRQRKKNKKHTKSAESAGPKIQPTQTTKMSACYYALKKINNRKKTQWNGRTTMNHICTGQTTGIWGGKEVEKHNNARSNNAKTQQTKPRKSTAQKMQ